MKRIPISLVIIILLIIILNACASESLTSYEVQDRYNRTVTDYAICLDAAERQGVPWYTSRHIKKKDEPGFLDMRSEMAQNGCKIRYR